MLSKRDTNQNIKLITSLIFFIFLALYPKYSPFIHPENINDNSLTNHIFQLYFFIANQTLGIVHESGHGVCYILHCPQFITALNGTIFQISFPLGIYFYYKIKKNPFASYIALFFTGFSLSYTAWYIGTANQGLFLSASKSFLGVDGYHDFNYILSRLSILKYYSQISISVWILAFGVMIYSIYKMFIFSISGKNRA